MGLINYVTRVQFGYGEIRVLADELRLAGIARPMVVTDKGVLALGVIERIEALLPSGFAAVYDETPGNPTEAAAKAATQRFREAGADGIVAVGGGSALDLAKAVAVMAAHDGPLKTFAAIEGGLAKITARTYPTLAVPTTAGTGSEVGRAAIIILDDGRKVGLLSPFLVPKAAIVDPELTLSLPPHLTAATGMDAISHCIETFIAPSFNPPADGIALEGLRLGWKSLPQAVAEPGDRQARADMAIAATMGAMAFQKGLGCVHSLSHSLGGLNPKLHHGTLNAIFMPSVLSFNSQAESVVAQDKYARLADTMGLDRSADISEAVEAATRAIGLPARLSEVGVTRAMFEPIVSGALRDHSHLTNPREATAKDYHAMLDAAF